MTRERLQKYIFILLLVLLPTQLGLHFWPEWSYINGIRIDYFSPTLYVTDLLILFLFVLEIFNFQFSIFNKFSKYKFSILIFGVLVAVNCFFSLSPAVSVYKWVKVAEMGFLVWYVAKRGKFEAKWLLIPVFYESILAIWQWWQQGSVGGIWYWLGERMFNSGTPGIANTVINGQLILRPYGTFSHPNVLMGFLVVSLLLLAEYFPRISRGITVVILGVALIALVLTPSRGDLGKGWNLRQELNVTAFNRWRQSPLWGTGLGTSPLYRVKVSNYALAHQPTHNLYLLILAETGILGILGAGYLLTKIKIGWPLTAILFLGFFDHYFLTLQQGQLLLALILGLAWGRIKKAKKLEGW